MLEKVKKKKKYIYIDHILTCPHDKNHHNDNELSSPELGSLANLLHGHFICVDLNKHNSFTHIFSKSKNKQSSAVIKAQSPWHNTQTTVELFKELKPSSNI